MSSTNDTLRSFYMTEIAPLQGKVELAKAGGHTAKDSFYINRPEDSRVQMDFNEDLTTPEAIGAKLDAMWADTALAGMGAKLAKLSAEIETPEDTGTVSQLIYEMF